jgi:hypothetical protein
MKAGRRSGALFLERVGNGVILRVFCEFDCGSYFKPMDAAPMQ